VKLNKEIKKCSYQLVLCAALLAALFFCKGRPACAAEAKAAVGLSDWKLLPIKFVPVIDKFRLLAAKNPTAAFFKYMKPEVNSRLGELNKMLWPVSGAEDGWSFFFNTSPYTVNYIDVDKVVVAFYNPWSDVVLFTSWQNTFITDFEVVPGDFVRRNGRPAYESVPSWLRGRKGVLPLVVLRDNSEIINKINAMFSYRGRFRKLNNWRDANPNLKNPDVINTCILGSGIMLESNMVRLEKFFEDPSQKTVRAQLDIILTYLKNGMTDAVLAMGPETSDVSKNAIKKHMAKRWDMVYVASCSFNKKFSTVFLAVDGDNDTVISLSFRNEGAFMLKRMDFLKFSDFLKFGR
jgi:hypothetical protein